MVPHRFFANLHKMTLPRRTGSQGTIFRSRYSQYKSNRVLDDHYLRPTTVFPFHSLKPPHPRMTGALLGDVPTAEALPRGVNRLSFDVRNGDVTRIINCSPELDLLILTSDVALHVCTVIHVSLEHLTLRVFLILAARLFCIEFGYPSYARCLKNSCCKMRILPKSKQA